jgi:hypothetical protein
MMMNSRQRANMAIRQFKQSGFDMKQISVVGGADLDNKRREPNGGAPPAEILSGM